VRGRAEYPVDGDATDSKEQGKRFFLKKEAKTFVRWRARCGNAHAL
jgi:hypothetical protein